MHSLIQMLDSDDKKSMDIHGFIAAWYLWIGIIDLFKIQAFNSEHKDRPRFLIALYEWITNAIILFSGVHSSFALWRQFRVKNKFQQRMRH